jgi:hypothetical protein
MDASTFDSTMKAFRKRLPYKPFTIVLFNGEQIEVDHPDALLFRDGAGLYYAPGGILTIFDHEGVNQIVDDLKKQKAD